MPSYLRLYWSFATACFLLFVAASAASAQCGTNTIGFGDIGVVAGNPFSAEVVHTTSGSSDIKSTLGPTFPEWVARDSQGRVRTERIPGAFKRDNGPGAGTKVDQHLIMICDPVAQTLTQIDTLNATAKIIHSRPSAPSAPTQRTFCSSRLPSNRDGRLQIEDLGDQTIEGVEAHGERITMPMLGGAPSGISSSMPDENTRDVWCSDQLAAVVLSVMNHPKTGVKSSIAMQHIDRNEPDQALFQIPPDYAVTESVAEPRPRHTPALAPAAQP
jgi:hypothetical protein